MINDTTAVKVNQVYFENDKFSSEQKLEILQISDVHNRNLGGKYGRITELNPDLIVLTGDLIDRKTTDLTHTINLLEQLITIDRPIYFVSGNHEQESLMFEELRQVLLDYGVIELDNQYVMLEVDGIEFNLVGIANHTTGHADLNAAFEDVELAKPTILLSHAPLITDVQVDLILSGHTHGGQIRLPFIGGLIAPDQGFFPAYDKGAYQLDSGATLYIDSGLGTSFLPIRFLNQAQVTMLTIHGHN
ncbi:metallophosphoesterase [Amphibacillus indicireducens]|uniref:Metallophosphoesterase n=1 Tax=Amphibacillus indicireducens TaxID=1076330 RepID=A0ABP7V828_9BACI